VASSGIFSSILLPTPTEIGKVASMLATEGYGGRSFWECYGISMLRVALGFGIAVILGTLMGVSMGLSRPVAGLLYPLVEVYRPLPALAYYSLLVLLLGIGEASIITVLTLGGLPPIVLSTRDAARAVNPQRIEGALSLGLTRRQIIWKVILPSCIPDLLSSSRIGFGMSFTTLVAAEMIAGTSGLGWLVYQASQYAESAVVIVGLVAMGFTGIAIDYGFRLLQNLFAPWVGKS
jgi:taurine transport system permease protein